MYFFLGEKKYPVLMNLLVRKVYVYGYYLVIVSSSVGPDQGRDKAGDVVFVSMFANAAHECCLVCMPVAN